MDNHLILTHPKWIFFHKLCFISSLLRNSYTAFKFITFAFSSVCFFFDDNDLSPYSVSVFANNLTTQNQACLTAYSTCRKYQDDASPAISACDQSPTQLTSKLKSLTDNQNAVNRAQATIGQLKTRQLALNMRQLPSQYTCSDVVFLTSEMADALNENPASKLVGQLADKVANASSVVCSSAQIASLITLDNTINDAETNIAEELTNVQDSLQGLLQYHANI